MSISTYSYLITGATGTVGSLVVDRLLAAGAHVRVFVRDPRKVRGRVEVCVGDLGDVETLKPALEGVGAVWLVNSGPDLAARDGAAANAAREAGVSHVVKLSSYDATQQVGTGRWHACGEEAIRAAGVPYTFVQPSGFMSNALHWAESIKTNGVVRSATGNGRIPFIHPRDIADVAVQALTTREYRGASLSITGPEALSYGEMAEKIGAAIGRAIRVEAMSDDGVRHEQIRIGVSEAEVDAHLSIYRAIREGQLSQATDTVERVLGRKPIAFDRWITENLQAFVTPTAP